MSEPFPAPSSEEPNPSAPASFGNEPIAQASDPIEPSPEVATPVEHAAEVPAAFEVVEESVTPAIEEPLTPDTTHQAIHDSIVPPPPRPVLAVAAVAHGSPGVVLPLESARPKLVLIGGTLGIVGCIAGLAMLMAACGGVSTGKAFFVAEYLVYLSIGGLILSIIGGLTQKKDVAEDTAVLAAAFPCILAIIRAVLEMAVFKGWKIL